MTCLAIDADDVIFDTTQYIFNYLNDYFMGSYTREQFNNWNVHDQLPIEHQSVVNSLKLSKGWVQSLPVREDFHHFRANLPKSVELFVVTSPNIKSDYWMIERTRALLELGFKKNQIIQMSCKHKFECDVFVDDCPDHVEKWSQAFPTGKAFCLTYSNTKGLVSSEKEITSLCEILGNL